MTDKLIVCAGVIGAIVLLILAGISAEQKRKEWEEFKASHACKVIGEMDGSIFNTFGVGSNGSPVVGVGSTPSKTGWACNDGITYWK